MGIYTFSGDNPDHTNLQSMRIPIKYVSDGKMQLQDIQLLCRYLYKQRDLDPQYLFMSEKDHKDFSEEKELNTHICIAPSCRRIPGEADRMRNLMQNRFINQVTGTDMHMIALPELESETIIVGFFGR
jgi:hypothetical protein